MIILMNEIKVNGIVDTRQRVIRFNKGSFQNCQIQQFYPRKIQIPWLKKYIYSLHKFLIIFKLKNYTQKVSQKIEKLEASKYYVIFNSTKKKKLELNPKVKRRSL